MIHFSDHVRKILISQLINDISRVLQKILKCFNGTAFSSFIMAALLVLRKILIEIVINFWMFLSNYNCIILNIEALAILFPLSLTTVMSPLTGIFASL